MGLFNQSLSRMLSFCIVIMAGIGGFTGIAKAGIAPDSLIAYWNFNDEPNGAVSAPLQANVGSGEIDLSGFGGFGAIGGFAVGSGTTQNALFGDTAGKAFGVSWGSAGAGNFTYVDFEFSMANRQDLTMSFAQRPRWSPATGDHTFDSHVWSWSNDSVNFTDAIGYEITTFDPWTVRNLDFTSITALNGAEDVTLRLTLFGADSGQYTNFDNIQIHGTTIPAPGALALFACLGLCGARRRRLV